MFHSAHIQVPNRQRRRTGLTTFFPSSNFSPPSSRETMRKGILFCSGAVILLLVGSILTKLEYNNMFGGKISMAGPLLIAIAVVLSLLSIRQFRLARKRNNNTANSTGSLQLEAMNPGGVTALVIDHEDGVGTTAVVLENEVGEIEAESPRVHGDATPPSYRDATYLDCSSTCPSFVSHDDHNEAPPTYEETCGIFIYGSETSLNGSTSHKCITIESSPKSQHICSPGLATTNTQRSMNTLSPSTALFVNPISRPALLTTRSESKDSAKNEITCCSNVSISSDETITLASPPENVTGSEGAKPVDWSRRSYASIPSYTCLLSESGEVSSQVFNPSSIISQMNPTAPADQDPSEPCPLTSTSAPTRSHSASSINRLRQGVPYDLALTASPKTERSQLGSLSSIGHNLDSPTRRRSEGSRSDVPSGTQRYRLHPRSDSNINDLNSSSIPPSSIPLIHRSFDEGESRRRDLVGSSQMEAHSLSSLSHHSHELLTQDIQETI